MKLCKLAGNHRKIITLQRCTNFPHTVITSPAARGNWHLCCIWNIISELLWLAVWKPADYFNRPFQTLKKVPSSEVWYYWACVWCGKIQTWIEPCNFLCAVFYWTDLLCTLKRGGDLTRWSPFLGATKEIMSSIIQTQFFNNHFYSILIWNICLCYVFL